MKFKNPIPITDIANYYNIELKGNKEILANGLNEIHKVEEGDITFVDHPKYYAASLGSAASIIIIDKDVEVPEGKAILVTDRPFDVYNDLAKRYRPFRHFKQKDVYEYDKTNIIEDGATICDNVRIGKNCYIQTGAYIGSDTVIGDNVIIQAGALIGTDAFYFKKIEGKYTKWHTCGRVIIENDVVIGAGCTINKGVSGDTILGEGSKLDSQVHMGHGAVLGKNCLLAAQVGIGGKTIVGNNVVMYGQVGVAQSIHIGDNVTILAKSGVSKSLEADKTYFGYPAQEARQSYKELATLRRMTK